jgi:hypothetical protein
MKTEERKNICLQPNCRSAAVPVKAIPSSPDQIKSQHRINEIVQDCSLERIHRALSAEENRPSKPSGEEML